MKLKTNPFFNLTPILIIILTTTSTAIEDDVKCLEGVKTSLTDPQSKLTWTFTNTSIAFISKLVGVSCWNEKVNRLISLQLSTMSLAVRLPDSIPGLKFLDSCGPI